MGNPDLVIIINNDEWSILIKSSEYSTTENAIVKAMSSWNKYCKSLEEIADFPEKINSEIKHIQVVKLY